MNRIVSRQVPTECISNTITMDEHKTIATEYFPPPPQVSLQQQQQPQLLHQHLPHIYLNTFAQCVGIKRHCAKKKTKNITPVIDILKRY